MNANTVQSIRMPSKPSTIERKNIALKIHQQALPRKKKWKQKQSKHHTQNEEINLKWKIEITMASQCEQQRAGDVFFSC